jgi:hypothetical protein
MSARLRHLNATIANAHGKQKLVLVEGALGGHPSLRAITKARMQMAARPDVSWWVVGHLAHLQIEDPIPQASASAPSKATG